MVDTYDIVVQSGQLPAAKGTLYTVPAGKSAFISCITLVNTNAAQQIGEIYSNPTGSASRYLVPFRMDERDRVVERNHTLPSGGKLEGISTNANVVDYVIEIIEKTPSA